MASPHLDDADFPKLKKKGLSTGTVTGSELETGEIVFITSKNGKKTWAGTVGLQVTPPPDSTWNASVVNVLWNANLDKLVETVTVTVSNLSGPSNPVITTSDIS